MRAIPNLTVLSPADCTETVKATEAALRHDGPVYLRLTGGPNSPVVYAEDYDFRIGRAVPLRRGDDLTLIATGTMVHEALKAAEALADNGVSAGVLDMHTLKPLDRDAVIAACRHSRLIVTVEEHSVVGGLGSAVAEVLAETGNTVSQRVLGLPDSFGKPNDYRSSLEESGLTGTAIAQRALRALRR
jgi:transketolase